MYILSEVIRRAWLRARRKIFKYAVVMSTVGVAQMKAK